MIHLYQLRLLNSGGNYFIMVQEMTLWWYNYHRLCGIRQSRENAKMQKCKNAPSICFTQVRAYLIYIGRQLQCCHYCLQYLWNLNSATIKDLTPNGT